MSGQASNDESLPEGAAGPPRQTEAFLSLLGTHERGLFLYIYAMCASWQDAEEVMQRVRIRLWQQFEQYDTDKPFEPWARAIAYYLVLAYRKEKKRRREVFSEAVLEAISAGYEQQVTELGGRREALHDCLENLDKKRQGVVEAYYNKQDGETTETLAVKLSMTPAALRQAIYRIRRQLLECVQRKLGQGALIP